MFIWTNFIKTRIFGMSDKKNDNFKEKQEDIGDVSNRQRKGRC